MVKKNQWTTGILAEFVHDLRALKPDAALCAAAGDALIDLLGCAAAGFSTPAARAARATARELFAPGSSGIWFSPQSLCAAGSALANSTAASALDLDDGHRQAGGHPGAAVIPAALAAACPDRTSGPDLARALAAGYEVAVRIAAARDFSRLDTLSTGRWCAYGVVAAAGLLGGDPPGVLAQALGIAGVLSPGLSAAGYSTIMGNQVKEGIPWALLTGMTALGLARQGMTGPLDILDHADYFDASKVLAGLGQGFMLQSVYFKPYACCRWIHAALDALGALIGGAPEGAAGIQAIDVFTFARALRLNNEADPQTLEGAQYSLPFCLGLYAVKGAQTLLPMSPEHLHHPEAVALARRVRLHVDPDLDTRFPAEAGARVRVVFADRTEEKTLRFPLGDPANPMNRALLTAKFRTLAGGVLSPEKLENLPAAVGMIADLPDLRPIMAGLTG